LITGSEFDGDTLDFIIANTMFHHNGIFNDSKHSDDTRGIVLLFNIARQYSVSIYMDNTIISKSGGLGAYISCGQITNKLVVKLVNVAIVNNSQGGVFCRLQAPCHTVFVVDSSKFAYNSNGSLKSILFVNNGGVWLNRVSIFHNKGTFTKDLLQGTDDGIHEGVGIFLMVGALSMFINILSCDIYKNVGGIHSIVYIKCFTYQKIHQEALMDSSNFTDNVGPALRISET